MHRIHTRARTQNGWPVLRCCVLIQQPARYRCFTSRRININPSVFCVFGSMLLFGLSHTVHAIHTCILLLNRCVTLSFSCFTSFVSVAVMLLSVQFSVYSNQWNRNESWYNIYANVLLVQLSNTQPRTHGSSHRHTARWLSRHLVRMNFYLVLNHHQLMWWW